MAAQTGWLTKKQGIGQKWLRRWFELDADRGELVYYASEDKKDQKGSIKLQQSSDVRVSTAPGAAATEIEVVAPERTWRIRAETEVELEMWLQAIRQSTEAAGEAEEGVPPQLPDPVANPQVGGMFMRWDPTDPAAREAPAKWSAAVATMKALPPISEKGFEAQQSIMDFGEEIKTWRGDTMIPFKDEDVTTGQLTAMLRSRGTIADGVSVSAIEKKALGIQGILSQTYRYTVTYEEGGEGPKSIIAKFAPPAVDWKFLTGSTCLKSLAEEVTVYETEIFTKIGLGENVGAQAQPQCFFTAYDDIREELIILLEDFGERALTAGDQISGGPATGKPPSLEKFMPAFKAAGDLNGKYFVSIS
eukprot:COSAG02_NODE_178_length_31091_cov_59.242482_17_plen_361_part_00